MDICIFNSNTNVNAQDYEVVERKGIGHPDTICDTLAEKISANYSLYTYQKYGHIFRHMIDKLSILGGKTNESFGGGEFIKPIRILLNGRFTGNFCDEKIPYIDIVTEIINYAKLCDMNDFDELFEQHIKAYQIRNNEETNITNYILNIKFTIVINSIIT